MNTHLHTYKCPRCQLKIMTTPVKSEYRHPYRCNFCTSWMRLTWSDEITTDEQRALAKRGVVFDPYAPKREPVTRLKCDICTLPVVTGFGYYGVVIEGLGNFCCERHADEGSARHEQAMNHSFQEQR